VQGVQAPAQKFWFVENWGKISENFGKIPENPNKIPKYLGEIPENLGKNGAQHCLTSNMAHNICRKTSKDHFLEITPKNGRQNLHGNFLAKFGKIWAKCFAPQKIRLLLHLCVGERRAVALNPWPFKWGTTVAKVTFHR